jgi:Zn finger protein HypA/HybF involved in hydrogenase expression
MEPTHICDNCDTSFYSKFFHNICPNCGDYTFETSEINPSEFYQYKGIEFELPAGCVPVYIEI